MSKISQMAPAAALTGGELVEVVQGGTNVRTTARALAAAGASTQADLQTALDAGYGVGWRGDITLTSTLFVRTEGCILDCRNTRFIWDGPAGGTAIQVERALCYLAGFQVVPGASDLGAAINLANAAEPAHSAVSILERVKLGIYNSRRMDAGIRISGQVNGDSMDIRDVWISGAKVAAVDVLNPQAINCGFDGLWMGYNERGVWLHGSDGGGDYGPGKFLVRRVNSHFATTADFVVGPSAGLDVQGFNGEHSARLAIVGANSEMALHHGYWQRGVEAVAESAGTLLGPGAGIGGWLSLRDFRFASVVAGSAPEQAVGFNRRRWDMSPANLDNIIGLSNGARPAPSAIADRHPWWDTTANKWVYNDLAGNVWRDAVGTAVA